MTDNEPTNVEKVEATPATGAATTQPQKTEADKAAPSWDEYKTVQRELAKSQKEANEHRIRAEASSELKGLIQDLHSRTEANEARLQDFITGQQSLSDDGSTSSTHFTQYQVREQQRQAQRQMETWNAKVKQTHDRIKAMLKEAELDPETDDWKDIWEAQDLLDATEKLSKRFLDTHKKVKEHATADMQKLADQKVKEALIAAGVHRVDMGPNAASDWETVRAAFIQNPSNPSIQSQYLRMKQQRGT